MAGLPKQRILLVDRALQFRYARLGMGVGLFSALLTSFLILYPLYYFRILVIPTFLPLPILLMMSSGVLINIVLIGIFTVSVSHRIAGPVFSFVKKFRDIQAGEFSKAYLDLRPTDDLIFMQRHYNETVDALIAMAKKDLAGLDDLSDSLSLDVMQTKLIVLRQKVITRIKK